MKEPRKFLGGCSPPGLSSDNSHLHLEFVQIKKLILEGNGGMSSYVWYAIIESFPYHVNG